MAVGVGAPDRRPSELHRRRLPDPAEIIGYPTTYSVQVTFPNTGSGECPRTAGQLHYTGAYGEGFCDAESGAGTGHGERLSRPLGGAKPARRGLHLLPALRLRHGTRARSDSTSRSHSHSRTLAQASVLRMSHLVSASSASRDPRVCNAGAATRRGETPFFLRYAFACPPDGEAD